MSGAAPTADQSHAVAMVTAADLGCGLCRKRTGEVVTKLCHACGLPVHLSCAQHVAARDCGLEFGFPLPSVYCCKRCYEADFLGGATNDDELGGAAGKRWSPQVPNEVTGALTLKIGDVSRTSRKHLSITTFRFLLSEGFDVFKAKVNSRTLKELQSHTVETYVREDAAIYIRPGVHSKQAELVELTEKNFEARIRKTFRNFLKRKATQSAAAAGAAALRQEQFECDIYTYVKKESSMRRRGGGSAAIAAANGANGRGGGVKMLTGLAAQHHLMHPQPRHQQSNDEFADALSAGSGVTSDSTSLAADAAVSASSTSVIGGKRRLSETQDREAAALTDAALPGYKSIRMVLNGAVVPVKVNVADIFAALGLPVAVLQAGLGGVAQLESDGEML